MSLTILLVIQGITYLLLIKVLGDFTFKSVEKCESTNTKAMIIENCIANSQGLSFSLDVLIPANKVFVSFLFSD